MKALTRSLLVVLAGAAALGAALPSLADHGRGWDRPEYRDHRPHWKAHRHHRHAFGPPVLVYNPPVVIHRPPVVVYEPPLVYERRVYYGPTCHTWYDHEPTVSFSFTVPLR